MRTAPGVSVTSQPRQVRTSRCMTCINRARHPSGWFEPHQSLRRRSRIGCTFLDKTAAKTMNKQPTPDEHLEIRSLLGLDKQRVSRVLDRKLLVWARAGRAPPVACRFCHLAQRLERRADLCRRAGEPRRSHGHHHGDRLRAADEPGRCLERIVRHDPQRLRGL